MHIVHLILCILFDIISLGGDILKLCYKIDVLFALKSAGYSSYRLRRDKIFGEALIQKLRRCEGVGWDTLELICNLLHCQPSDIIDMR